MPTIIVLHEFCVPLANSLSRQGCLVLKARDRGDAVAIARTHSRPIHLLLTDTRSENADLGNLLRNFRPHLDVVHLPGRYTEADLLEIMQRIGQILGRIR